MTPEQKNPVKPSWKGVTPTAGKVAELFQVKLLELGPSVKPLFKSGMREQGAKLTKMPGLAVNSLARSAGGHCAGAAVSGTAAYGVRGQKRADHGHGTLAAAMKVTA
jgi:hypothetical protein